MGLTADLIEADLDGIDPREMSEHFRAAASLTDRQLSGMLGWAQQAQDTPVYEVAYAMNVSREDTSLVRRNLITRENLPEDIAVECDSIASRLRGLIDTIKAHGYDPAHIGIQPCGIDQEIDLEAIFRELSDVAGYLPANGWLHPLPAKAPTEPSPWEPSF